MKVYSIKTNGSDHSTPIKVDNANVYIKFTKVYYKDKLAYFQTDDEKLIKAIESSKSFNDGIICKVEIPKEQTISEQKAIEKATKLAEEEKAKSEQETAAKLAEEAKAKSEQEAAVKLEEEKAKSEQETAAKLAEEAKAKSEQEAAVKLEEEKAKSEQETAAKLEEDKKTSESKVYTEVTNPQQAKELLRKEPFSVNHQSLKTPEAIRAKAVELGVSFPNWKD